MFANAFKGNAISEDGSALTSGHPRVPILMLLLLTIAEPLFEITRHNKV
tara:strand:- start:31 stop:177 length:147 start_codon:yes stop_codon:yes gene_type:complete